MKTLLIVAIVAAMAGMACAQTPEPDVAQNITPNMTNEWALTEVTVVQNLTGPAMWKVIRGDKAVWLIGDTRIEAARSWDDARIERILSGAEGLYLPPAPKFGLMSFYSVMTGKDLPGKQTLREVLPTTEYDRWRRISQTYGIDTTDMEKDKPLWAGVRLLEAVSVKQGYSNHAVTQHLSRIAKRHKVRVQRISTLKAQPLIRQINAISDAEGRRCLTALLDLTEYMVASTGAQSEAWANGDVAGHKALLKQQPQSECHAALGHTLASQWTADTIQMITTAMQGSRRSVLVLPAHMLLDDSLVSELRNQGYQVLPPR